MSDGMFLVFLVYFVGFIVALHVLVWRAGGDGLPYLSVRVQSAHPRSGGRLSGGLWSLKTIAKAQLWPLSLLAWLAKGRPSTPIIFGAVGPDRPASPAARAYWWATRFDRSTSGSED